jgi:putative inorganic carbon (hco3(-)) transporter
MPSIGLGLLMFLVAGMGLVGWPFCAMMIYVWMDHTGAQFQLYGPMSSIPYSQIIGASALVGWLIHERNKTKMLNPITGLVALYTVWICITTFFAVIPDSAMWKWDRTMKVLLSSILVGLMLTSKNRMAALMWTIVIAVGVYIARGALRTLATGGGGLLVVGLEGTFVGERNTFATTVAGILPMIYALYRFPMVVKPSPLIKVGLWIAFIGGVIAILGTFSRSGIVSMVLVLALLVWSFSKYRIAMLGISFVLAVASIPLLPDEAVERVSAIGEYKEDSSATSRITAWKFGLDAALASPIVGGGFKIFQLNKAPADHNSEAGYIDAHSFFFEILGEHGFVGIAIFCLLWFVSAFNCFRLAKPKSAATGSSELTWINVYGRCLFIGLCGYSIGGLFNALGSYAYFYLVFCAIGSLTVLSRQEAKIGIQETPRRNSFSRLPAKGNAFDFK